MKTVIPNIVFLWICAFLLASAHAEPMIELGSGTVQGGSAVEIPIVFNNASDIVGVQFDVVFQPSFFDDVDTSQCFSQMAKDGLLAAWR